MTQTKDNTNSRKGKHLSYSERSQIMVLKKENYSNREIARVLNRVPQTINNEIIRGTITQMKRQKQSGKIYDYYYKVYDAEAGQAAYEKHRINSKWTNTDAFVDWADDKMLNEGWSPDVVVGFALKHELYDPAIIPCTTTLYQWIDRGIMKTKNMDLVEKPSRKIKATSRKDCPNKRVLGKSIEERPEVIDTRKTFGHWEIDTVIGSKKNTEPVLLTLAERKTRFEVVLKLDGKEAQAVDQAIRKLRDRAGSEFPNLFKTITSDNGSEFSGLHEALQEVINVYFTHPYSSWERGTSENQHKLIRRFIPKGKPISEVSEEHCIRIQQWMNDYPRKILGYKTPHECFVKEFKKERLLNLGVLDKKPSSAWFVC